MGPWSPAVVDGVVFNADTRGVIVARDLASGAHVWESEIGAPANSVSVADGLALVGDADGMGTPISMSAGADSGFAPLALGRLRSTHRAPPQGDIETCVLGTGGSTVGGVRAGPEHERDRGTCG
jgi:hypothetical protein